jgi:hypothetical protein
MPRMAPLHSLEAPQWSNTSSPRSPSRSPLPHSLVAAPPESPRFRVLPACPRCPAFPASPQVSPRALLPSRRLPRLPDCLQRPCGAAAALSRYSVRARPTFFLYAASLGPAGRRTTPCGTAAASDRSASLPDRLELGAAGSELRSPRSGSRIGGTTLGWTFDGLTAIVRPLEPPRGSAGSRRRRMKEFVGGGRRADAPSDERR